MKKITKQLNLEELNRQLQRAKDILDCLSSPFPDRIEVMNRKHQNQLIAKLEKSIELLTTQ